MISWQRREAPDACGTRGSRRGLPYIERMVHISLVDTGPAGDEEVAAVRSILTESGLPDDGIQALADTLLVARMDEEIMGCAALEPYPPAALLRSVAVRGEWRGRGVGWRLTEAALSLAADLGIERVYLLTETASQFFSAFGFRTVGREEVDARVRRSQEFTSLCPESADAMVLELREWRGRGRKEEGAPLTS